MAHNDDDASFSGEIIVFQGLQLLGEGPRPAPVNPPVAIGSRQIEQRAVLNAAFTAQPTPTAHKYHETNGTTNMKQTVGPTRFPRTFAKMVSLMRWDGDVDLSATLPERYSGGRQSGSCCTPKDCDRRQRIPTQEKVEPAELRHNGFKDRKAEDSTPPPAFLHWAPPTPTGPCDLERRPAALPTAPPLRPEASRCPKHSVPGPPAKPPTGAPGASRDRETPRSSESTPSVAAAEEDWTGRVGTIGEGEEASEGHDDRCEEEAQEEEGEEEEVEEGEEEDHEDAEDLEPNFEGGEFEEDWEQYEDYHREEDTDEDGETGDGVDPDPTSANEGTAAEGWDGDDAATDSTPEEVYTPSTWALQNGALDQYLPAATGHPLETLGAQWLTALHAGRFTAPQHPWHPNPNPFPATPFASPLATWQVQVQVQALLLLHQLQAARLPR